MDESLAIRSMVMYAASSNVKSFMIWPDSLSLVKMLRERGSSLALFGILFDIYHFSFSFFAFVSHLSNVKVDSAAKISSSLINSSSFSGL